MLIPYADNMNICGIDKQAVQVAKDKVVTQLRKMKFRLHEEQDATPVVQALRTTLLALSPAACFRSSC